MDFKIFSTAFAGAALLGIYGFVEYQKNTQYVSVEATVTSWRVDCYAVKRNANYKESKRRFPIRNVSCSDMKSNATLARRYDPRYRVRYSFEYKSPADGSLQTGKRDREGLRKVERPCVGERIQIHAHKSKPTATM